ncbi:MAG: hypothetical protein GY856_13645 [bacterium]|nr:hypothetical protein [bacterium]
MITRTMKHGFLVILIASGLLVAPASPARAEVPQTPPPPQPAKKVRFPAFEQKTLANGLEVVVIEHHEQPLVSLRLVIRGGRLCEGADQPGLAQATAALLTQGSASRSAQEIAKTIDFVGGALGAGAGADQIFASARATSDQLDLGLELLSDVVVRPSFPEEEIERWRTQSLNGLRLQMQDPAFLADATFDRAVFGTHPYGHPATGTPESVRRFTREDFVAFHSAHVRPERSILAVVGDVEPDAAFAKVRHFFGDWEKGEPWTPPKFNAPERRAPHVLIIDKPDAVQTQLRVGHLGIPTTDPDYFIAQVYNSVVGGGVSARLYEEIRRKRGLSYSARSHLMTLSETGSFDASTFTKTESTPEALGLVFEVLRGMQRELVGDQELTARKTFISGSFPLRIETPDGIAGRVLGAMLDGYGKEYIESYRDRIDAVTAQEVKRFAESRTYPDRALTVLVGNASGFIEELGETYGKVEIIAHAELDLTADDLRRPPPAVAAEPADAAEHEAAMALLGETLEALGGEAFLQQRSQIGRGSGTLSPPTMPQPLPVSSVTFYELRPDPASPSKHRVEMTLPMGTVIQAFDGEVGWVSMAGRRSDQTARMKDSQHYGINLLRRLGQAGITARPLDDESVNEKPCKVVELTDGEGHATRFYLDAETRLVFKVAFSSGGSATERYYADYRQIEGIRVPHRIITLLDREQVSEIELSEVEINPRIDDELFRMPSG